MVTLGMERNKKTLEQVRADGALTVVQGWEGKSWKAGATQRVKELPLMVRNNGLGQTLAVLMKESKKRGESKALLEALTEWLLQDSPVRAYLETKEVKPEALLAACFSGGRAQYQLAQQEAVAFLGWLKVFAEAMAEERG